MHVQLQCQKGVLTEGWCVCGCHHLWNWLDCPCVFLSLHFWRLGVMQVPIGNMMMVWKLKHQVVQVLINPSKRKFQKCQSLALYLRSKGLLETKKIASFKHIKCRIGWDMKWARTHLKMVCICKQSSQMCSSPQTWKSLASANGCRGWCICSKPAKCKKGVAPCRCVSQTCTNAHLHHPTHVQQCLHFPLRM